VLPLVARIARELSAWLAPAFGEALRLWYAADQVEGLAAERDALWARIGAAGFLTDDEKREAVGYQPRVPGRLQSDRPLPSVVTGAGRDPAVSQ
jgi:phage portal protein BeeE